MEQLVRGNLLERDVEEVGKELISKTKEYRKVYSEEEALECAKESIILKAANEVVEFKGDNTWFNEYKKTAEFRDLDAYLQMIYYTINEEITANICFFFYQLTHDLTKPFHFDLKEGFLEMRKALEDDKKQTRGYDKIASHPLFKIYLLEREWRTIQPKVHLNDSEKIQAFYAKKKI